VLAPSVASATASATARRPPPRLCDTTTLTPAPTIRKSTNSIASTWFATANAAPAMSETLAASTVPTMPTPMPSASSSRSGAAMLARRGAAGHAAARSWCAAAGVATALTAG
jgi:hypothetical protein